MSDTKSPRPTARWCQTPGQGPKEDRRALYRAGLSVGIAGHLSISVGENRMLANRFGPSFGTLPPDDVLLLDWGGNLIEGRGAVNDTVRLHGVIHKRNPSIVAVAHTHPPATVTLGTFRVVPDVWDQEGCLIAKHGAIKLVWADLLGKLRATGPDLLVARAALV